MCLGLGVQRLVQDLLRVPNALDGLIDAVLTLRDRRVGILGALGQLRTQLIGLTHQRVGLLVLLPAVSLPRLRFELGDLGDTLLRLLAGFLGALGLVGLTAGNLRRQVHRLLRVLAGLLQFTSSQRVAGLGLVLVDLALAVLGRLDLRHALPEDLADALLRRHRQQALLILDALDLRQVAVRLGVELIDVLTVLGRRLHHGLALGRQDLVFDAGDVGRAFLLRLTIATGGIDPRLGLIIDELERVGRRLPAQRSLLGQGITKQLRRLGYQRRFRLGLQFKRCLLLLVTRFHRLDLPLQVGFDDGGEPLVGLGHLGGRIVDHLCCLADRLLDLAQT